MFQLQESQELTILLLMDTNQNQMLFTKDKTTSNLKDQRLEANMAEVSDHTSKLQVKLAAVMIKRAL